MKKQIAFTFSLAICTLLSFNSFAQSESDDRMSLQVVREIDNQPSDKKILLVDSSSRRESRDGRLQLGAKENREDARSLKLGASADLEKNSGGRQSDRPAKLEVNRMMNSSGGWLPEFAEMSMNIAGALNEISHNLGSSGTSQELTEVLQGSDFSLTKTVVLDVKDLSVQSANCLLRK